MSIVSDRQATPTAPALPAPPAATQPSRAPLTHSVLALGVVLVAVGAYLPWLTVYNGLTPIPGFRLGGGPLAGIAVAGAGLVLVSVHRGGGRVLRPVAALGSAVVVVGALYVAHGVVGYAADPGPAGPLLMPQAGFGAYVMAAGGLSLLMAAVLARPVSRASTALTAVLWLQLVLAALTLGAGWVHLLLAPEHLAEHPLLGMGFIAAGVAQVALAVLVVARPTMTTLPLLIVLDVAIMAVYAYAALVGLPFAADDGMAGMAGMAGMDMSDDHGLVLGAGEAVDLVGGLTFVAELVGVGLVIALVRRLAGGVRTAP